MNVEKSGMKIFRRLITIIFFVPSVVLGQLPETKNWISTRHSIEISPMSPVFKIWAVQFSYRLSPKNEGILGLAYANIKYDEGRSHAPTLLIGYRHFFWKGLHLEYQLWPAYNAYFENNEVAYYKGFELWNEFRTGYLIDFMIGDTPVFINPQLLFGFGLYAGNKPESFKKQVENEFLFVYPNVFVGIRF